MSTAKIFETNLSAAVVDLLYQRALSSTAGAQASLFGLDAECIQMLKHLPPTDLQMLARNLCYGNAIQVSLDPKKFRLAALDRIETREKSEMLKEMIRLDAPFNLVSKYFAVSKYDFTELRNQLGMISLGKHKARQTADRNSRQYDNLTRFVGLLLDLKNKDSIDDLDYLDWLTLSRLTGLSIRIIWNTMNDCIEQKSRASRW
jgi:hypothetical protein